MKSMIATALVLFSTVAMACPGSHLMTFKFKGKDAFVLDMSTGKINRVENNKTVALLTLEIGGSIICVESPMSRSRCSIMFPTRNIYGLTGNVRLFNKKANLIVRLTDGTKTTEIKVDTFPGLARSAAGCGPVVE